MNATVIINEEMCEPKIFTYPLSRLGIINEVKDVWELLEGIWRDFNVVDGSEWIAGKKCRSMCVGDMVIIDDKIYCAMSSGFIQLP